MSFLSNREQFDINQSNNVKYLSSRERTMAVRSCFFCPKEQGSSVKDAEGWVTFRPNNADLIRESICFLSKVLDFDELYSVDLDLTIITKGISFCLECVFLFRQVLETYGKLFPLLPKIKANVEMKLKRESLYNI